MNKPGYIIYLFSLILMLSDSCQNPCSDGDLSTDCLEIGEYSQPNIMIFIADDWGWPHAGAYGDKIVKTPSFDKLCNEGVLFQNAFVSSPSCTPSRNAILTGQDFWRLEEGANLRSTLNIEFPTFPGILQDKGYFLGSFRKTWGPGKYGAGGYQELPTGKPYSTKEAFVRFLSDKPKDAPFCFWFGTNDPHRPYDENAGINSGIDPNEIELPGFLPDEAIIKNDMADYYSEIERFDSEIGITIQLMESLGILENTIIVITSDHGMPFPRCKANLYDYGSRVPLLILWGKNINQGQVVEDMVSLTDLAPTILEAASTNIPDEMTGKSLIGLLKGEYSRPRDFVVYGRERHALGQMVPSSRGYPARALRTKDYLYIHNFFPERWPVGVMVGATSGRVYSDCDDSPSKTFMLGLRDLEGYQLYYDLCFGKRPKHELYNVSNDPYQIHNLAYKPQFQALRWSLYEQLMTELRKREDPRVIGGGEAFDNYPYYF